MGGNTGRIDRLPDDVLLKLMEHLDPVSLCCFVRVCRIFDWLFEDHIAKHGKHGDPICRLSRSPYDDSGLEKFLQLVTRDVLCFECQEHYKGGCESKMARYKSRTREPLHCTLCAADHPASLFSAEQR